MAGRADLPVQCCRCRNKHNESDRHDVPHKAIAGATQSVCPRCGGTTFYDVTPTVAYCWATGVIEFGSEVPDGAIQIAEGPKAHLQAAVSVAARHGHADGVLLVPGIPEAAGNQRAAGDALKRWLDWYGRRAKNGVVFMSMKPAEEAA